MNFKIILLLLFSLFIYSCDQNISKKKQVLQRLKKNIRIQVLHSIFDDNLEKIKN